MRHVSTTRFFFTVSISIFAIQFKIFSSVHVNTCETQRNLLIIIIIFECSYWMNNIYFFLISRRRKKSMDELFKNRDNEGIFKI